jgi:hypothetical protein
MRSSLARCLPDSGTSPEQFESMRAAAYHRGAILVMPDDDLGEWLRAALEAWAMRKWGNRR